MLILFATPLFSNSWAGDSAHSYIKVGLFYGNNAIEACTIRSEQGFILGSADESGFTEGMPLPAYTSIIVSVDHGAVIIKDENGTLLSAGLSSSSCLMPADYKNGGILYLGGTSYRGGLMFLEKGSPEMTIINYISVEHYVYGVLNAELHHTNPKEALKAQAVAARSFGYVCKGNHNSDGFDVCTTTHCQVYKGFSGEYAETNQAVDDTRGEMIYSKGKPVTAFYFKNSGGHTQNIEDVWYVSQPYLRAVRDEFSPSYPWTFSISFDTIRQKLEDSGYSPGNIESVAIKSRIPTGSVVDLEILGSNETINLKKEKIRNVLGATSVKSLMFQLEEGVESDSNYQTMIAVSNGSNTINLNSDVYIISGDNKISKQQTSNIYGSNGNTNVKLNTQMNFTEIVTSGIVTFHGYGYGHGIGMPQDSAIEMAKQGFTYDEILHKYYTNIEIR